MQDVGAHRRKVYGTNLTTEDELWKRAFWYGRFLSACPLAFELTHPSGFWWLWIVRQVRASDDLVPYKMKSRSDLGKQYGPLGDQRTFYPSFDLDLPAECDDECWSPPDPKDAFKQPPGKPSKMAFFIAYLKLSQILAFALRTIVSNSFLCHARTNQPTITDSIQSINRKHCSGLSANSGSNTLSPNSTRR